MNYTIICIRWNSGLHFHLPYNHMMNDLTLIVIRTIGWAKKIGTSNSTDQWAEFLADHNDYEE